MKKMFWIDMEMTGLNVQNEVIIEVAAIVTDLSLKELERYHAVVKQPEEKLKAMDEWNQKHHQMSGLLDLIPSGKSLEKVQRDLLDLIGKHFVDEKVVLAGNSIGQDRLFIDKYLPQFAEKLHYRMIDVSSFKMIFLHMFGKVHKKKNVHRAVDDILESIEELQYYLEHISLPRLSIS
ncbi:MAG: oligoribonuclease [Bdellovibrionales bacterium]|nr:oligoribonuclease [Bdellovibrionales bacterium]